MSDLIIGFLFFFFLFLSIEIVGTLDRSYFTHGAARDCQWSIPREIFLRKDKNLTDNAQQIHNGESQRTSPNR